MIPRGIANHISIARIFFSITILFIRPLSILFLLVYILCGITDILDGYIARKTHTESSLGSKIDSIADLIMIIVLMLVLFPFFHPNHKIIVWVVIIGVIKLISIIIVFIKYRTFQIIHTYGNKIVGFLLFMYPISLYFNQSNIFLYTTCIIASLAAFEEILINVSSNVLIADKRSIFYN